MGEEQPRRMVHMDGGDRGEVRGIGEWHQVALFIEEVIKANPREGT